MSKRTWILPTLLIAVGASAPSGARQDPGRADLAGALRDVLGHSMEAGSIEALALAVAIGPETVFAEGRGPARPGKSAKASADTVFGAASMAHAFLVTAALKLEAEGKLSHEDKVASHVPELVAKDCAVRVGELLAHTSGLADYRDNVPQEVWRKGRPTIDELAGLVRELPPVTAPGECVEPNATDTLLLAALLEEVAGKGVEELLRSSIFAPLGMKDTLYELEEPDAGVSEASAKGEDRPAFLPRGLRSTAADLLRFQRGLVDLSLLDSDELETMNAPVRLADGSQANSGLGVLRVRLHETEGLVLGEAQDGTGALLAYYPEFDLAIAVVARGEDAAPERVARAAARLVIVEPDVGVRDLPLTEAQMKPYLGNYQIGCTTVLIRGAMGRLVLDEVDEGPTVLAYQGEHVFLAQGDPDVRLVFEVEDELASRFVLERHGVRSVAVRFRKDG